jgi:phospholipase C
MLVVSPWSKGGWVCSQVFDHTSIIQFMEQRFGVREPNVSPWRRTVCGDLTSAFNFVRPDEKPVALPATGGYTPKDHVRHNDYVPAPPANPALPRQERGVRPARPLPYALGTDGKATGGRFRIDFTSGGRAGVCFYVTSANRADGPWTYTVEAGKKLSDTWDTTGTQNAYDFSVFGPNGFLRRFKGRTAGPEVTARHDGDRGDLRLDLTNSGHSDCRLTITDAYGGRSATYTVRPGRHVVHSADLRHNHSWYDLSVVSDTDSTFLRRFAGHVETGRASASDPAINVR